MSTRNTIQKDIILNAVVELGNHPTAELVYEHIHSAYPGVGKATVYRNLKYLSESGKLKRIESVNQADHYDHQCHDHYHMQCTNCNRVFDVDLDYMEELNNIQVADGFEIHGHDIVFKGLCPDCLNLMESM